MFFLPALYLSMVCQSYGEKASDKMVSNSERIISLILETEFKIDGSDRKLCRFDLFVSHSYSQALEVVSNFFISSFLWERPLSCGERDKNDKIQRVTLYGEEISIYSAE
ncbi:hypothetical protein MSSIT_1827 [Methanosarcina siciliae T4/M]|uniref:Uncharacterized protein n=2 Tax=Methanosarcina siciliae TaxID=38027 RepID=A0A0E3PE44_9EURY|nr:hypothetical protein MSSIT_1827 [Methanosarcina siciliae T4/M]AKB32457.1 hypothetical protein MSSIH_1767 [Methanosarcina siciliae HI350]